MGIEGFTIPESYYSLEATRNSGDAMPLLIVVLILAIILVCYDYSGYESRRTKKEDKSK